MSGLERVTARRIWFVPNVTVYGSTEAATIPMIAHEITDGQQFVFYADTEIDGDIQYLSFASLVDHRGNHLPPSIDTPRVIPRSKSHYAVHVDGTENNKGFRIARDPAAPGSVIADLLVVEMGR